MFESFSRPSRLSVIEPPTIVIPCLRAQPAIAPTVSPPSSGSAAARIVSTDPNAFHFSGSATSSAPSAAASATRLSAVAMFSDFSARALSWTHATRRRSAMCLRIALRP